MKNIISFIIGIITFVALVWFLDGWLVNVIVDAFPASAHDWLTLIRIATWIVVLWATFGICVLISSLIASITMVLLGRKELKRHINKINKVDTRSKWQQRLDEMKNRKS